MWYISICLIFTLTIAAILLQLSLTFTSKDLFLFLAVEYLLPSFFRSKVCSSSSKQTTTCLGGVSVAFETIATMPCKGSKLSKNASLEWGPHMNNARNCTKIIDFMDETGLTSSISRYHLSHLKRYVKGKTDLTALSDIDPDEIGPMPSESEASDEEEDKKSKLGQKRKIGGTIKKATNQPNTADKSDNDKEKTHTKTSAYRNLDHQLKTYIKTKTLDVDLTLKHYHNYIHIYGGLQDTIHKQWSNIAPKIPELKKLKPKDLGKIKESEFQKLARGEDDEDEENNEGGKDEEEGKSDEDEENEGNPRDEDEEDESNTKSKGKGKQVEKGKQVGNKGDEAHEENIVEEGNGNEPEIEAGPHPKKAKMGSNQTSRQRGRSVLALPSGKQHVAIEDFIRVATIAAAQHRDLVRSAELLRGKRDQMDHWLSEFNRDRSNLDNVLIKYDITPKHLSEFQQRNQFLASSANDQRQQLGGSGSNSLNYQRHNSSGSEVFGTPQSYRSPISGHNNHRDQYQLSYFGLDESGQQSQQQSAGFGSFGRSNQYQQGPGSGSLQRATSSSYKAWSRYQSFSQR